MEHIFWRITDALQQPQPQPQPILLILFQHLNHMFQSDDVFISVDVIHHFT